MAVTWYAMTSLREMHESFLQNKLVTLNHFIEREIQNKQWPLRQEWVNPLIRELGDLGQTRITIIMPNGKVIGDTDENPDEMDNHSHRPEIQESLKKGLGQSLRYSQTVQKRMMYAAMPIQKKNETMAVVRTSIPVKSILEVVRPIYLKLITAGLLVAVIAALISLIISKKLTSPLESLKEGAQRFAQRDFSRTLEVPDNDEMARLASTMNVMASELDQQFRTINQQRNLQEAILGSMIEGVLAIDENERLLSLNLSAAEWLGIDPKKSDKKSFSELINNNELHHFVQRSLLEKETIEDQILVEFNQEKRYLQARGTTLYNPEGEPIGAVIVLVDVTRLKQLENIRREFVANVSHELKTPVTSIKGFVETLLDGAMEDEENATRFLKIISKQADRLSAIIEDLLSLSRIEQSSQVEKSEKISLEPSPIRPVIESSVECCKPKAEAKEITIDMECDENFIININPPLLEQALINLIDNAIKYSDEREHIFIFCTENEHQVCINVQDRGVGIKEEHLLRIFERFYRVDKARSRKLGGTGLGLAIVKHIIQSHKGNVTVHSVWNEGSTFTIQLPKM